MHVGQLIGTMFLVYLSLDIKLCQINILRSLCKTDIKTGTSTSLWFVTSFYNSRSWGQRSRIKLLLTKKDIYGQYYQFIFGVNLPIVSHLILTAAPKFMKIVHRILKLDVLLMPRIPPPAAKISNAIFSFIFVCTEDFFFFVKGA